MLNKLIKFLSETVIEKPNSFTTIERKWFKRKVKIDVTKMSKSIEEDILKSKVKSFKIDKELNFDRNVFVYKDFITNSRLKTRNEILLVIAWSTKSLEDLKEKIRQAFELNGKEKSIKIDRFVC